MEMAYFRFAIILIISSLLDRNVLGELDGGNNVNSEEEPMQNDYGYGGGTYQRSASADASGSVYGIKDQQILSNYGEQTKILEFPIGHHHDHIQGHGHHAYGHSSRPAASGYGKKFNLKNLPLVGGFFGSKTSGGAGGGIYNSGSSYSIDGFNDPGTAFEFKINAKENQYSNERIEGETHVWKSSELEMQSSENPSKSCNKKIKTPMNAAVKCSSEVCKVKCMADYQFPNGDTMLTISCIDGEWVMQGSEWDETPSCEPVCETSCTNNGICISPGQCSCPENYFGPFCEHEKKLCLSKPLAPQNSRLSCSSEACSITCAMGYKFPDGSGIANLVCMQGEWTPTRAEFAIIPDCIPTCTPDCQNGGQCISYDICQCPENYRGKQCQYNVEACAPVKLNFNGAFNCSGDSEHMRCALACPENIAFDGQPAPFYTCAYEQGIYSPAFVPQCKYPDGMRVIQGNATSQTSYKTYNRTISSGQRVKKIRKLKKPKKDIVEDDDDEEGYEKVITKTQIKIVKKKKKKSKGRGSDEDEDEYEEYDDDEGGSETEYRIMAGVYSLYLTGDVQVKHQTPKPAACMTWNGNKVKTFDGLTYAHNLYCSHTLVQDIVDGSFSVVLKACPAEPSGQCAFALQIFVQSLKYTIDVRDGVVRLYTADKELWIPAQMLGMRVNILGHNVKVYLEGIGLTILWDMNKLVTIEASAALFNRTAGLCGTLDQRTENDFMSKNGAIHKTTATFVDSWQLQNLDEPKNCAGKQNEGMELVCDEDVKAEAENVCKQILNNEKFTDCLKVFNRKAVMETCISDYCYCPSDIRAQCACDGLSVFAKDCQLRGIKLDQEWRDTEICPLKCKPGRIYKACGPSFEATCGSTSEDVLDACNEGCFCPDGTVQHNGECIQIEHCPCTLRGKTFKSGSHIRKDCNTCRCERGIWKCSDHTCGARCGAIGDPHYRTFDSKRFDFMGKCSYYLLKTDNFSIEAENIACSGSISEAMNFGLSGVDMPSCTKSVTINVMNGDKTKTIKLKQGRQITVDGIEIQKLPIKVLNGLIKVRQTSSIIVSVVFEDGLKVIWDGMTRVYIDAPASYRGRTQGLCGTFNSNLADDFLTPEGDVETSVSSFADKWRTKESCEYVSDSPNVPHPCQLNIENQEKALSVCSKLKSKVFDDCQWYVDPQSYYEDCMYDICACKGDLASCLCPIFSAYSNECARQGVPINWRYSVNECAVKCPAGQVFEECGDECFRTCADLQSTTPCKTGCVEGCRCPLGQALHESNECVPIASCPCVYKGLEFKPGYKEVRAGTKYLELCTCINAQWKCREAIGNDKNQYPPASDLRNKCLASNNEEFSTCEPAEPMTCKNMHHYQESSTVECHPGCVCKKGYVFDTSLKACVLPADCSCHHANKSYKDGDQIRSDCNTCTCKAGNWNCTTHQCPSTCSTWGDSHFETFDGRDFDFQGACNYVLTKGVLNDDEGFSVTIQNVLCGSLGVTCSKSVTVAVFGQHPESVTLNSGAAIPGSVDDGENKKEIYKDANLKRLVILRAGIFIIVEIPGMGIRIKWDRRTRIYISLAVQWKGKVLGLCGNYNDDAMDDFTTPSSGIESSATIFGDSWKLQDFCAKPTDQIDSCQAHPERKIWAERKCGVLKSDTFKACHSEVSVDRFWKRCIYDTCACDQGGDCECLCTALAAYAHACTVKGVPIRWRTPDLCPMQCDPKCSEYKPCISVCPIETCDSSNKRGKEQTLCTEDTCVEGCQLKGCPDGYIYANDSYAECIPKSVCKPVCMEIDNVIFYEGEITKHDNCHTCRCSKGVETCAGVPCPDKSILPYHTTQVPYQDFKAACISGWTAWINQDKSDAHKEANGKQNQKINDVEPLPSFFLLKNLVSSASCDVASMRQIECRSVNSHINPKQTGEDAECSLERGLYCDGLCHDYEIRVLCDCDDIIEVFTLPTVSHGDRRRFSTPSPSASRMIQSTTMSTPTTHDACNPAVPHVEFPGDCYKFLHCQPMDGSWKYVEKTCGPSMMFNPLAMICDWPASVLAMKPSCGQMRILETSTSKLQIIEIKDCPAGKIWSDCALPCGRTCHFYGKFLNRNGACLNGHSACEAGCVDEGTVASCPSGQLWRDNRMCVGIADCTCESDDGKLVKPGAIHKESDCKVCQCIDNAYVCDIELCKKPTVIEPVEVITVVKEPPLPIVVNTVTPPQNCEPSRLVPLIESQPGLPDSAFNASSYLGGSFKPHYSRLNSVPNVESSGAWSPKINDQMQYLEIAFPKVTPLYGIIIRGHPLFDQYVTSFKILHSYDGVAFHYLVDGTKLPQIFSGPIDPRIPVQSSFKIPIEAKVVRIYPLTWHGGIAVRAELLGCTMKQPDLPITQPTPKIIEDNVVFPMCDEPMGIDNEQMQSVQIHVSSKKTHIPESEIHNFMKVSTPKGWRPNIDSPNEYVLIDFLEPRNVTGLKTKGGEYGWVTGYNVYYSADRITWNPVINADGVVKTFLGNYDSESVKTNSFRRTINMQYLKVVPAKWHDTIELSVEPMGCFKPYPHREKLIAATTASPLLPPSNRTVCGICPEVLYDAATLIENTCRCYPPLFWNGDECVERVMCPCMVGHMAYSVGAHYEHDDCSKCVCVLGGVAQCKPLQCPPCPKGLREVPSSVCTCRCEPCPDSHILCPTSGACIPKSAWCNGIQDCPDDEVNCSYKNQEVTKVIHKTIEKVTIIKKCPTPSCPPGFELVIAKKINANNNLDAIVFPENDGDGDSYNPLIDVRFGSSRENTDNDKYDIDLPKPGNVQLPASGGGADECAQFDCVPIKPAIIQQSQNQIELVCPKPECPKGYESVVDEVPTHKCAKYRCEPLPQNDAVCNMTGRTLNTFDDITFKYDICNHLLARDLVGNKWSVSIAKNCATGNYMCKKEIIIKDKENAYAIRLFTDLTLTLDDYQFTVDQLQKSTSNKLRTFVVSKVGNTLVFVSHTHSFWVRFDELGDVKIGVASKYASVVDGLCGYFNNNPNDDKRLPNGEQTLSTIDFGDAWLLDKDSKQKCEPQACSQEWQETALQMCNKAKDESFARCASAINVDHFISKCLETACECLKGESLTNTGDVDKMKDACSCSILQNFVSACLAADETIYLDSWRSIHNCYKECPQPLVYKDCYRRRCEPSCTLLAGDDCPQLPGTCFSGCYCPEGSVRKGDQCLSPSECKDCVCNGYGQSQYLTYDKQNFTFNGNCTYLLTRDTLLPDVHTFQVYVTLGMCEQKSARTSSKSTCSKSLHILYGPHIVHIQRNELKPETLDVLIDGALAPLPYESAWIVVSKRHGNGININFIKSLVELDAQFDDLSFSIKLPGMKYGSKLEGLCGDCNGDPHDDIKANPKSKLPPNSEKLDDILLTWLADEPSLAKEEYCVSEEKSTEDCIPLPPESDPCLTILSETIFGQCHLIVEPVTYVSSCQVDMCKTGPNQKSACSYLAAYARECAQNGVCVDWRKHDLCKENIECPAGMVYESCGCHITCDDHKESNSTSHKCPLPESEGCFCPKGTALSNGKCILQKECNPCDEHGHFDGDIWHPDKCTQCECQKNGQVQCVKNQCTSQIACNTGFHKVAINDHSECCPKSICCPDLEEIGCGRNQKVITVKEDGCEKQKCVCDPKVIENCKPLTPRQPLQPGERNEVDESGCCPINKVVCNKSTCPPRPFKCDEELYEVATIKHASDDLCCDIFECRPPKDHCIVENDENKKQLKNIGEIWATNNPCVYKKCAFGEGGHAIVVEDEQTCQISACPEAFKLVTPTDKCCGVCEQTHCLVDGVRREPNSEWESTDLCISFKCSDTFVISSMHKTCPDVKSCPPHLKYFEDCCDRCKLEPENKENCLATSLAESKTVGFVEKYMAGHGLCSNQNPIRSFTECNGACNSGTKFNKITFKHDKRCDCCSVKTYNKVVVPMKCPDGHTEDLSIDVPSTCACQRCDAHSDDSNKTNIHDFVNLEAHSKY